MDNQVIAPLLVSLLIGWSIYRRARRSFGPQLVRPTRIWIRTAVLALVGALALLASAANATLLKATAGGLAGGIALAVVGLRHTKFEATREGRFYTPHTYIGLFVSALFVARIAFRVMSVYLVPRAIAAPESPLEQVQRNPLTLAIFGVLAGYYVAFNLGVLRYSRNLPLAEAAPSTSVR